MIVHHEQPLVYTKPYAKPIFPIHAAKLQRGDFTVTSVHNCAQPKLRPTNGFDNLHSELKVFHDV